MNLNPKPGPNKNWQANSEYINSKIKTIIGLLILFSVGLGLVYGLTLERKNRQNNVANEIQSKYGLNHIISSPVFTDPQNPNKTIHPQDLDIQVTSTHQTKNRGIFRMPVYLADVEINGTFYSNTDFIQTYLKTNHPYDFNIHPIITINGISKKTLDFEIENFKTTHYLSSNPKHKFNIKFQVQGTKEILFNINPNSKNNNIQINSSWPYPNFQSPIGTKSSQINKDGFQVIWNFEGQELDNSDNKFGYKLFEPNDIYKKTDRSIKYGICVITLVFFSFMVVELLSGVRVNNIQYILVGLSLLVYYTLLLSLGEIIGFGLAYLIASLATIGLNISFAKLVLKESKYSLSIGSLLAIIYLLIFILLQTTQYTLLLGSLTAYLVVGVSMFATYFINFDQINLKNK